MLFIFFPIAILLHNIEEALWLPKWSQHAKAFHKPVEKNEFHFALIVITGLALLSTYLLVLLPQSQVIRYFYFGFVGSMIVNAVAPHMIATVVLKKYSPGLFTGLTLNIPINTSILITAVERGMISSIELVLSVVGVGVILVLLIPMLFRVGRKIIQY